MLGMVARRCGVDRHAADKIFRFIADLGSGVAASAARITLDVLVTATISKGRLCSQKCRAAGRSTERDSGLA
ncbi:hypothetical protein [Sphingomonas sp. TDK1]|jgi:hypothetical protein|uniref:hypothetical protein n=1 Tax=Sphingomonas sp. TDK1 TaxID=453247 RepID=UPI0007D92512|nr:hypothetical protein [Sphingomonas sp. TDK1]OAN64975.1 hypothetical protein A7X12_16520 [Sphingomonas sp. TDK1]